MTHTLTTRGPYTQDELARIIAVISDIEATRPNETFSVYIEMLDVEADEAEAARLLQEICPKRDDYERVIWYGVPPRC